MGKTNKQTFQITFEILHCFNFAGTGVAETPANSSLHVVNYPSAIARWYAAALPRSMLDRGL